MNIINIIIKIIYNIEYYWCMISFISFQINWKKYKKCNISNKVSTKIDKILYPEPLNGLNKTMYNHMINYIIIVPVTWLIT